MENTLQHQHMMRRCLQLAKNGLGTTYPNPLVGCVIVLEDKIIGEGWHDMAGKPHAEINAINAVQDKALLKNSTLYVNLEPCSHYGKTPPCSHKIVEMGIPRVVVGTRDYAAHVNGEGIKYLKGHGVEVLENVLTDSCYNLNKRFFTFHKSKRPYIILKWAETQDGYFAPSTNTQKWITNPFSKQRVHLWRTQEQAILVGGQTVRTDNPQLNARLWHGTNPIKIVCSNHLNPTDNFKVFKGNKTYILGKGETMEHQQVERIALDGKKDFITTVLNFLYSKNIQSVIVEGGKDILQQFINANQWDQARILKGKTVWNQGIKAPEIGHLKPLTEESMGDDSYAIYLNNTL